MITYVKGDLFAQEHQYIAHGVNCQGKMNSGVAKIIRNKWPVVYDRYKEYCEQRDPEWNLGRVCAVSVSDKTVIFNCFTQLAYGYGGSRYISYDAMDECMYNINERLLLEQKLQSELIQLSMPKIGAGLGGGEWSIIEPIIKHRLSNIQVNIYEL